MYSLSVCLSALNDKGLLIQMCTFSARASGTDTVCTRYKYKSHTGQYLLENQ